MADDDRQKWTGKLIDAAGRQASMDVLLLDQGRAAWKVSILERDGEPIILEGESPMEGNPKEGIRLESREELPEGGSVTWQLEMDPADAAQYARAALLGKYSTTVEGSDLSLPLTRGILIIWHFG